MTHNIDEERQQTAEHSSMAGHIATTTSIALLSFSAGALHWLPGSSWVNWSWGTPWGQLCLVIAGVWCGTVVMSLIVARNRSAEADRTMMAIDRANRDALALIDVIDQKELEIPPSRKDDDSNAGRSNRVAKPSR